MGMMGKEVRQLSQRTMAGCVGAAKDTCRPHSGQG